MVTGMYNALPLNIFKNINFLSLLGLTGSYLLKFKEIPIYINFYLTKFLQLIFLILLNNVNILVC